MTKFNSIGLAKAPENTLVVVAMSGGVDSSTVAALMKNEGYKVIGITLKLYNETKEIAKSKQCCAGQDIMDAKRVADKLKIEHRILYYQDQLIYNYFLNPNDKMDIIDFALDFALAPPPFATPSFRPPIAPFLTINFGGSVEASLQTAFKTAISVNDIQNIYESFSNIPDDYQDTDIYLANIVKSLAKTSMENTSINLDQTKVTVGADIWLSLALDAVIGAIKATASLKSKLELTPKILSNGSKVAKQEIFLDEIFVDPYPDDPDDQVLVNASINPPLGLYKAKLNLDLSQVDSKDTNLMDVYPYINVGFNPIYFKRNNLEEYTRIKPNEQEINNWLAVNSTGWIRHNQSISELKKALDDYNPSTSVLPITFDFTDSENYIFQQLKDNIESILSTEQISNSELLTSQVLALAQPSATDTTIAGNDKATIGSLVNVQKRLDDNYKPMTINDKEKLSNSDDSQPEGSLSWINYYTFDPEDSNQSSLFI